MCALRHVNQKLEDIKMLVSVQQEDLDALDTALDEATAAISARIQALVDAGTLPVADVSALQADVETLRALAAPTPPVE